MYSGEIIRDVNENFKGNFEKFEGEDVGIQNYGS